MSGQCPTEAAVVLLCSDRSESPRWMDAGQQVSDLPIGIGSFVAGGPMPWPRPEPLTKRDARQYSAASF